MINRFSKTIRGFSGNIQVQLFTDGSCWPNPGVVGSYAFVIKTPDKSYIKRSGVVEGVCTNNKMELMAAIEGLKFLKEPTSVELITDSSYLGLGLTSWMNSWKKGGWRQPNADLWQELYRLYNYHNIYVTVIKGHSGQTENEICDQLAAQAMEDFKNGKI